MTHLNVFHKHLEEGSLGIELHMLLLKGFLQEAKKLSGASAISVGNVVLESLCTIYLQDFQMLPAKGLPKALSWECFEML